MRLSPELAEKLRRRLSELIADEAATPADIRELAARTQALPLTCDMGGCVALRLDGEVILVLWDEPIEPSILSDLRIQNAALLQGSKKYPDLAEIAPTRPDGAPACQQCEGTGIVPVPRDWGVDLECFCGGLGWLPVPTVSAMLTCPYCSAKLVWGLVREPAEANEFRYGCCIPERGGSMRVKCGGCRRVVTYAIDLNGVESVVAAEQPKWWQFWW